MLRLRSALLATSNLMLQDSSTFSSWKDTSSMFDYGYVFVCLPQESERAALHEAMEQQCVHVAKAGLVAALRTRTAVLGVTNPKGPFRPQLPLAGQINIQGPLLSRWAPERPLPALQRCCHRPRSKY